MKAPDDKEKWIIEPIGASIVKEIFSRFYKMIDFILKGENTL